MQRHTGAVVPLSALYTKDCPLCGDFPALKDFADFCEMAGITLIQLLPVNDSGTQSSPYSGLSAFALHPMYIRISALPEFEEALKNDKAFASAYKSFTKESKYSRRFSYNDVVEKKYKILHLMYNYIEKVASGKVKTSNKIDENAKKKVSPVEKVPSLLIKYAKTNPWVTEYAVFKNLKDINNQASWKQWDEMFCTMTRDQIALRWQNKALRSSHNFYVWLQLRAEEQFEQSAEYLRKKGIVLKGDIPILMNEDSVDCWTYPEYFRQEWRAGSPPDGENPLGQNWGFPTYDWDKLAEDDYKWWKDRVKTSAKFYDAFRIDHVLGFFRIWASKESETTAYLGHTIPFCTFSRKTLNEAGFTDDRIKWLSQPHIPTSLIENITWNHDEATSFLQSVCDRINNEELWTFKKEIDSDSKIYGAKFCDDEGKNQAVRNALAVKWRDRSLIEIEKNKFIKVYTYQNSTAWITLSGEEREKLSKIFSDNDEKENKLWKKQSLANLDAIVNATDMIACAEDLGANLPCLHEVLDKLDILSLKVIRWCRCWEKESQPFIPLKDYPEKSVTTTSVHDSSTLRQWWNQEKSSVQKFLELQEDAGKPESNSAFTPEIAEYVLNKSAECNSALFINPLQDYLYLDHALYLENENDERINVPGSVNDFNWTYRIPVSVEDLCKNTALIEKIKAVAAKHNGTCEQ